MIVVDINVIAFLMLRGEQTPIASKVAERDADWCAPALWRSEMLNVLADYIRRGTLSLDDALSVFGAASNFLNDDVTKNESLILELVSNSECTSYDCEYIAAAVSLGVPLITADKQILKAFPKIAISMLDFSK